MAQVIRRSDGKVLFDGDADSGRKYVEDNFPRMHNPEKPDVHFLTDDGEEVTYHDAWSDNDDGVSNAAIDEDTQEIDDSDDESDDDSGDAPAAPATPFGGSL